MSGVSGISIDRMHLASARSSLQTMANGRSRSPLAGAAGIILRYMLQHRSHPRMLTVFERLVCLAPLPLGSGLGEGERHHCNESGTRGLYSSTLILRLLPIREKEPKPTESTMHPALKVLITAVLIVVVTEVSKRTGYLGGLIASLPLVSYLSIIWLYVENDDKAKATEVIGQHSISVFWFVLPTLPFFVLLRSF